MNKSIIKVNSKKIFQIEKNMQENWGGEKSTGHLQRMLMRLASEFSLPAPDSRKQYKNSFKSYEVKLPFNIWYCIFKQLLNLTRKAGISMHTKT